MLCACVVAVTDHIATKRTVNDYAFACRVLDAINNSSRYFFTFQNPVEVIAAFNYVCDFIVCQKGNLHFRPPMVCFSGLLRYVIK